MDIRLILCKLDLVDLNTGLSRWCAGCDVKGQAGGNGSGEGECEELGGAWHSVLFYLFIIDTYGAGAYICSLKVS